MDDEAEKRSAGLKQAVGAEKKPKWEELKNRWLVGMEDGW